MCVSYGGPPFHQRSTIPFAPHMCIHRELLDKRLVLAAGAMQEDWPAYAFLLGVQALPVALGECRCHCRCTCNREVEGLARK